MPVDNKAAIAPSELRAVCDRYYARLVLTNGCFDMLHVGHIAALRAAHDLGHVLVVVLNSDMSVRMLKGEGRPIVPQDERREILLELRSVWNVYITDETHVANEIRRIRPHIWAKGGDYTLDTLNPIEVRAAQEVGAEIVLVDKVGDVESTTERIARLRGS